MDKLEETAAIRRCQAGDKEAFRVLAEEHERALFGVAYLMTLDRDLASDVVQETLLKMWKHLPSLRGDGLKPWLTRILVNEVRQRGRKKETPMAPIEEAFEVADKERMERGIERDELGGAVREAVSALPDKQKEAVVLRYFGDLTLAEVAVAMGCREGTVKSRLSRALDHLQQRLDGAGVREAMER